MILAPQNLSLHVNYAIWGSNHEDSELTEKFLVINILLPVRALRTDEWKQKLLGRDSSTQPVYFNFLSHSIFKLHIL